MSIAARQKLGSLCSVVTKGTTPTSLGMKFEENGVPFLRIQNLNNSTVNLEDVLFISEETHDALERSKIRAGDFLITIAGTIGRVAIVPDEFPEANCNQAVAILRFDQSKLSPRFLLHWLSTNDAMRQISGKKVTATISNLSLGQIKELEIPLPPLEEQKRIAAILDKADSVRSKRQQAIDLADDFLRSVFLEMFGDPVTNPKGWEVKPLSSFVSKLGDGLHGTPNYDPDGEYFFVNGNNLIDGKIVINGNTKKVNEEEYQKHKKELNSNTMLVSINGTIGKVAFYNEEKILLGKSACYFNLIPDSISSAYLYYLIQSHYFLHYVSTVVTGSTIKNVSLKSMRELPIPLPDKDLQDKFESIVKKAQELKAKHKFSNLNSEDSFNSLCQRAFAGEL